MSVTHQVISPKNKPDMSILAPISDISPSLTPNHANNANIAIAVRGFVIVKIKPVAKSLDIDMILPGSVMSFGLERKIRIDI